MLMLSPKVRRNWKLFAEEAQSSESLSKGRKKIALTL